MLEFINNQNKIGEISGSFFFKFGMVTSEENLKGIGISQNPGKHEEKLGRNKYIFIYL